MNKIPSGELYTELLKDSLNPSDVTKVQDLLEDLAQQESPNPTTVRTLLIKLHAPEEAVLRIGEKPKLDEEKIKEVYSAPRENYGEPPAFVTPGGDVKCTVMIITIVADVIGIVLAAMGLYPVIARRAGTTLAGYKEMGKVATSAMGVLIKEFSEAVKLKQKMKMAELVLKIAQVGINTVGTRVVLRAVAAQMKWYDWLVTAVWLGAELVAFVTTGGVSLVAQVVLILASAGFLALDVKKYIDNCS